MITDFAALIVVEEETVNSTNSDRVKLNRLGTIYLEASQYLLVKSQELLELTTQQDVDADGDVQIDESFEELLNSLMRQSVSGNFLDEFLVPRARKEYERSNVEIVELDEIAVVSFVEDLVLDNELDEVYELAHDENVADWVECLVAVMESQERVSIGFSQLVELSGLSCGRVLLALLHRRDRFILSRNQEYFYGDFMIKVLVGK